MGMQHEFQLTVASEYVKTDEERQWQRYLEGCPKMHKAFPHDEVLISKGERYINFLLPQSVSGFTKTTSRKDL